MQRESEGKKTMGVRSEIEQSIFLKGVHNGG
jgi:hypothetical protein